MRANDCVYCALSLLVLVRPTGLAMCDRWLRFFSPFSMYEADCEQAVVPRHV